MADDYSNESPADGEPAADVEKPAAEKTDDEILAEALARFDLAQTAETEIRKLALDDLEFRFGKQWPEAVVSERQSDGRPCLVINRIPQFIQQITNDQRQNRPSIKVHPVDDRADVETAKVIQGLIRHIEYDSSADAAYDTAFDAAATGGFGYFRIVTDYVSPTSFDQKLLIKRIRNPFSVFFDPHSQESDGSDANFAFVIEELSRDEYKARYPKSDLANAEWEATGNAPPNWIKESSARVAEYFYKDTREEELALLDSGEVVLASELDELMQASAAAGVLPQVVRTRKALVPFVRWCKLNGTEILEKREWPGKYIPIIPVYGTEGYIDGKRILEGVVRNAKDSQRMYNYWASAETEAIALAPRTPFIIAAGQVEGFEAEWKSANRRNHAYLTYKPLATNGMAVPPPQRNSFEPAVQAITQARMLASDDLKATTGIYDAALGNKSNESSGVAIQRRNMQAQTSNFHFIDNLTRSLKHAGRVLIDLIPHIYDTARAERIIGEEGDEEVVKLNAPTQRKGKDVLYALDAGVYDVTVDVGPSFASKRQEAVASMMEVTKAYPPLAQFAGDLMVKNMDWPGAAEIADRLKKTLPPGLADDPEKKGKALPPEAQAQMQQMSQMIEQLTGKLNEASDTIQQKRIELESKERIEFKKLEVQLEIARAQLDAKDSLALLNAEIGSIEQRLSLLNSHVPIADVTQDEPQPEPMAPMGADVGLGGGDPTGGESPGSPMGMPNDEPPAPF